MHSHEIESLKKNLRINKKQRSMLIGTLLGDGHLETQDNGRTYRLKIEHSVKQLAYEEWLYEQFKNLVRAPLQMKVKKIGAKTTSSYSFSTYSLGLFRFYAQQFYQDGKKIMPKQIGKLIDPLAVAVWFMDDGSLKSSHHNSYIIHTLGYTKNDLYIIQDVFKSKFGIDASIHSQYDKYRLCIPASSANRFKGLIKPYILPLFAYKLGNKMPKE